MPERDATARRSIAVIGAGLDPISGGPPIRLALAHHSDRVGSPTSQARALAIAVDG